MRRMLIIMLSLLALSTAVSADLIMVQEQESNMPGGMSTQKITLKIKGEKTRIDIGEMSSTIIDHSTGENIGLMHMGKTYIKHTKSEEKEGLEMALNAMRGRIPAERPKLKQTADQRVINGWKAHRYLAESKDSKFEYWIAPELVRFQPQLEKLRDARFESFNKQFPDLHAIPGFPVLTIFEQTFGAMRIKTTIKVMSLKEEVIPESEFMIPLGYAKSEH